MPTRTLAVLYLAVLFTASPSCTQHQQAINYSHVNSVFSRMILRSENYNPMLRPRRNFRESVTVTVDFSLNSVLSLAQKEQDLSLIGWFHLAWKDDFVEDMFQQLRDDGIELVNMTVPAAQIWIPDLSIQTSDEYAPLDATRLTAKIFSNGLVKMDMGGVLKFRCSMNLTYFPLDEQQCETTFNPWASESHEVMLNAGQLEQNSGKQGEWAVVNMTRSIKVDEYYGYLISTLRLSILVRRRPLMPILTILLPTMLQSVLVVVVFLIPHDSGERISFAITVLLAFSVWSVTISDSMPRNDDTVPLLEICLCVLMSLSALAVVLSIIVGRLLSGNSHERVPATRWMQTLYCLLTRKKRSVQATESAECGWSWREIALALDKAFFVLFLLLFLSGFSALGATYFSIMRSRFSRRRGAAA